MNVTPQLAAGVRHPSSQIRDRQRFPLLWQTDVIVPRRGDVQSTYDQIAPHFAQTRPKPWPAVSEFLSDHAGSIGLDIGTGNGRHAVALAERTDHVLAMDLSAVALREAIDRVSDAASMVSFLQGDAAALPVRHRMVDVAVYVATLHHLPTRQLRRQSLNELERVLAVGGAAIVSGWSTSHDKFDREEGFDTTVPWTLPDGETVPRYYHIYDIDEFEHDINATSLQIRDLFEQAGNCYAIVGPKE